MTIDTFNQPPSVLVPLYAVLISQPQERLTPAHCHASGQLFGAVQGLLSIGAETAQWVVPASHCVWMPPHHSHSLRSHGPFAGWSVYVAEAACDRLPAAPFVLRVPTCCAWPWFVPPAGTVRCRASGRPGWRA